MIRILTLLTVIWFNSQNLFAQNPPEEFFKALENLKTDYRSAKGQFEKAIVKEPGFFGSYHFLGTIFLRENKLDSALQYFNRSITLNSSNINHTKEMTYARLINTYAYKRDFKKGFETAYEAYTRYPENQAINAALKDLCIWSFYIKSNLIDPSYLSQDIKEEYVVNSIPQEYLIVRTLRIEDEGLAVKGQRLVRRDNASYDVLNCTLPSSKKDLEIKFKLNWDMGKEFGGKPAPTKAVLEDSNSLVYEKLGALLVSDARADLRTAIEKYHKGSTN